MSKISDQYDAIYRDGTPPWAIGEPQPALARVLDEVRGPRVLDLGCGGGDLAITLARRGFEVTGVDISPVAIEQARASSQGLPIRFEVQDATRLSLPDAPFDSVIDSGLLHNLVRDENGRADEYLALLPGLTAPGGRFFLLAVSFDAGEGWGLTEQFLRTTFAEPGWTGTEIEDIEIAARVDGEPFALRGFLLGTTREN